MRYLLLYGMLIVSGQHFLMGMSSSSFDEDFSCCTDIDDSVFVSPTKPFAMQVDSDRWGFELQSPIYFKSDSPDREIAAETKATRSPQAPTFSRKRSFVDMSRSEEKLVCLSGELGEDFADGFCDSHCSDMTQETTQETIQASELSGMSNSYISVNESPIKKIKTVIAAKTEIKKKSPADRVKNLLTSLEDTPGNSKIQIKEEVFKTVALNILRGKGGVKGTKKCNSAKDVVALIESNSDRFIAQINPENTGITTEAQVMLCALQGIEDKFSIVDTHHVLHPEVNKKNRCTGKGGHDLSKYVAQQVESPLYEDPKREVFGIYLSGKPCFKSVVKSLAEEEVISWAQQGVPVAIADDGAIIKTFEDNYYMEYRQNGLFVPTIFPMVVIKKPADETELVSVGFISKFSPGRSSRIESFELQLSPEGYQQIKAAGKQLTSVAGGSQITNVTDQIYTRFQDALITAGINKSEFPTQIYFE